MRITQGTFSYLPDLTDEEIFAQIAYALGNGWACSVEFTDDPPGTTTGRCGACLPEHVEIALYRIAQEALQNVVKHAQAERVRLRLASDGDQVLLEVSDDGRGIFEGAEPADASNSGGFGMGSMTERAELIGGLLEVTSQPGQGTTVAARAPIKSPRG